MQRPARPSSTASLPLRGPEPFEAGLRFGARAAWLHLCGELDLASAPLLRVRLDEAMSCAQLVMVDLRHLAFTDCTGIHVMIDADAEARRGGRRLVFVRGPAQTDRLFALLGLSERLRVIDLKPDVAPAPVLSPAHDRPGAA